MDYQEFEKCVGVLWDKPKWFFQSDNIDQKLECLDTFETKGTPM